MQMKTGMEVHMMKYIMPLKIINRNFMDINLLMIRHRNFIMVLLQRMAVSS